MLKHALAVLALVTLALLPADQAVSAPYKIYPAEKWSFTVSFRRFPHAIACGEAKGRGKMRKSGSGGSVSYTLTGFPAPKTLVCELEGKGRFSFDLDHIFGVGRTKRTLSEPYLAGEAHKIEIKFVYLRSGGYGSFKSHLFARTSKGRDKHITGNDELFKLMFPERANAKTRWKP